MKMKNPTDNEVTVAELGHVVPPGATVDIPDGYCKPRTAPNQSKLCTIIEMLAPQLVPADESLHATWKTRAWELPSSAASNPVTPAAADLQARGMAPAVAAMVAEGNAEVAQKAQPRQAQQNPKAVPPKSFTP